MNYFDLHCDTPFELFHKGKHLSGDGTHITAGKVSRFGKYAQVFDIWSQRILTDDEAYARFFEIYDNFMRELSETPEFAFCRTYADLEKAERDGKHAAFLGVEGANLLGGNIKRLDELAAHGVRFLTLTWSGESVIGGAHGTDKGLTDFGRDVISRAGELGIIVDVSHGSDKLMGEAVELCAGKTPAIATHSNSRFCADHPRNLTDELAKRICECGGIIGVSMCDIHLKAGGGSDTSDVIRHLCHYLDLGLEKHICFGGDFDGTDLPTGMTDISSMEKVVCAARSAGIDEKTLDDVLYGNARAYFEKYL
ncbi:MAG: membrane dipeptidase [Clostridiales bacterium]|nr:membrane dipeptidase [Clostridiales bacterium]